MYSFKDIVKYSETNIKGELPLYGILTYFQDCINLHSREIGKADEFTQKIGKAWVLISWKIKIIKKIKIYDEIEIGTWSSGYNGMYGNRNYVIYDKDGEKLVYADTMWVLIDLKTRRPTRVTEDILEGYAMGEPLNMEKTSRKLEMSEDREKQEAVKVFKTYMDTNGHMNNTAYLRVAEEYIPDDFEYDTVDILYNKETVQGMIMIPYVHREEDKMEISFEGEDGTVFTKIKLYTAE